MNPIRNSIKNATDAIDTVTKDTTHKTRLVLENNNVVVKTKSVFSRIADAIFGRFFGKRTTDRDRLMQVLDKLDDLFSLQNIQNMLPAQKTEIEDKLFRLSRSRQFKDPQYQRIDQIYLRFQGFTPLGDKPTTAPRAATRAPRAATRATAAATPTTTKTEQPKVATTGTSTKAKPQTPKIQQIASLDRSQKTTLIGYLGLGGDPGNYRFDSFVKLGSGRYEINYYDFQQRKQMTDETMQARTPANIDDFLRGTQ